MVSNFLKKNSGRRQFKRICWEGQQKKKLDQHFPILALGGRFLEKIFRILSLVVEKLSTVIVNPDYYSN